VQIRLAETCLSAARVERLPRQPGPLPVFQKKLILRIRGFSSWQMRCFFFLFFWFISLQIESYHMGGLTHLKSFDREQLFEDQPKDYLFRCQQINQ
jgi:hypothetical protein